jgi:hypothetical protein
MVAMVFYYFMCPKNLFRYRPNLTLGIIAVVGLLLQALALSLQQERPRFFVPKLLRPNYYEYFRSSTQESEISLEDTDCII